MHINLKFEFKGMISWKMCALSTNLLCTKEKWTVFTNSRILSILFNTYKLH